MKNRVLYFFLLFLPLSSILSQNRIEFEITKGEYWVGKDQLSLEIKVNNISSDTVYIFSPNKDQFINHFTKRSSYMIKNQNQKAYRLKIRSNGECNQDIYSTPPPAPRIRFAMNKDIIEILPESNVEELEVTIDLEEVIFCDDVDYFCEMTYVASPAILSDEQRNTLLQLDEDLKKKIEEINKYIKTEKISDLKISERKYITRKIIDNNTLLQKISKVESSSKEVKLIKN